jgi:hypothetical protein
MAREQGTGAQAPASDKDKKKDKDKPAAKKPPRTYTDEDLKRARESGVGNVVFLPELPPESRSAGDEAGPVSDRDAERESWKSRAKSSLEQVAAAEEHIKNLESRIAELTNDMSQNPGDLFDPSRLQKREAEKHQKLKELEEAKQALVDARSAREAFEREAREANIPPGWLQP